LEANALPLSYTRRKLGNKAAKAEYDRLAALPSVGPDEWGNCPVRDYYAVRATLQQHPAVKLDVDAAG
jgi:hypothetical protein